MMTKEISTTTNDIHLTTNKDGVVMTTTTEVAKIFGRQHKNVMRAIDKIECSEEFTELNFEPSEYIDDSGKANKCYNLTKDGFVFLAMGFNGKKAAQFKEAYINEFNRMEAKLKHQNKEVELNHIQNRQGVWISTSEISVLFDIDNVVVLEMTKRLDSFFDDNPPWNSMGINKIRLMFGSKSDLNAFS